MNTTFLALLLGSTLAHAQQAPQTDHGTRHGLRAAPASPEDIDELINAAKAPRAEKENAENEERSNAVLTALGNPDPKAKAELEPTYVKMLDDKDPDIQAAAAAACGKLKATRVIPKVRAMLAAKTRHHFGKNDLGGASPAEIRQTQVIAKALADLGDYESMDDILSRDEVMGVSGFGGPLVAGFGAKILPKVVEIAHKNDMRKGGALHAIHFLNDPAAIPDLAKLAHDPDPQIASTALVTLKRLSKAAPERSANVEAAYQDQLKNGDYLVRAHAYAGLLSLDSKKYLRQVEDAIVKDWKVRFELLQELSANPPQEALPFLRKFIEDDAAWEPKETMNRKMAARAIYRLTGERVPYKGVEKDKVFHPDPYVP